MNIKKLVKYAIRKENPILLRKLSKHVTLDDKTPWRDLVRVVIDNKFQYNITKNGTLHKFIKENLCE